MSDCVEKIGESLIQHGPNNNRVYIMKVRTDDFADVVKRAEILSEENGYGKIFAKVPLTLGEQLEQKGYNREASVPYFFGNGETCVFLGKYLKEDRQTDERFTEIDENLKLAQSKSETDNRYPLREGFSISCLGKEDAKEMAEIYKVVFASYPFPIHDPVYLKKTMDLGVEYAGIRRDGKLVSLASAETSRKDLNAEMTDFATLPDWRGNGFALSLLFYLERRLRRKGFRTLYTIARALSPGMNITFKKAGYQFSGTLINNTCIAGNIESMNIWYKHIRTDGPLNSDVMIPKGEAHV